jgi:hypothetical protein
MADAEFGPITRVATRTAAFSVCIALRVVSGFANGNRAGMATRNFRLGSQGGALSESLLGLDRKADGDLCRPVEGLNEMTAEHAMEFALDSAAGTQLQAAIAGMAVRTDDVRFFHRSNMGSRDSFFQSGALS